MENEIADYAVQQMRDATPKASDGARAPRTQALSLEAESPMATVIDPVCGMRIEADDAAAIAEQEGQTYYFCSEACRDIFVSAPSAHEAPSPAMRLTS